MSVGVYVDEHRHSCLCVSRSKHTVKYVPVSVLEVTVHTMSVERFDKTFKALPDYLPQRAAARILHPSDGVKTPIALEARKYLEQIAGQPFVRDRLEDVDPRSILENHQQPEGNTMSEKAPKKRAAPAKPEVAAPSKKTAKTTKPAAAESPAGRGRTPNILGTAKIKVLVKDNPKRAAAAERFALYKSGMTVDEYIAAGGTRADVNWDVKQQFIEVK